MTFTGPNSKSFPGLRLRGLTESNIHCDVEDCPRAAVIEHSRGVSPGIAFPNAAVTVRFNLCGEHSEQHHRFTESGLNFTAAERMFGSRFGQ